ncbi:AraC family transcriptional regulator [Chitinophaga parva]|nr:AraC family transcriptional regulator [Chitinophaga parva]
MKAILKKAVPTPESSFNVHKDVGPEMLSAWHYHPEIELLLIKRSAGTCLIGDFVGPFKAGDVYLFGSNLPHTFRHESKYLFRPEDKIGESVVVLFPPDLMARHFGNLPECKAILKLLELANQGLRMQASSRKKVTPLLEEMLHATPSRRLVLLLSALECIAGERDYETISSSGFFHTANSLDQSRVQTIFDYTFSNFHRKILIEEVAAQISMSKHSFCRFFKAKTKKTYLDFLIEVRIGHACRLLLENSDLSVAEVSYMCGYNNLSHFYHQFKEIMQKNPLEYRAQYLKKDRVLIAI